MKQKQRKLAQEFAKLMRVALFMLTGEKVPPKKKINIESDDVVELFREYREEKVKLIQISTTLQRMPKSF